jgi:hypothetical protein
MRMLPWLTLLAGACLGYLGGVLQTAPNPAGSVSPDLQVRTEEFEPDCAMLVGSLNQPVLMQQGDDYFTVLSDGRRFTVWGLNVRERPAGAWWSAEFEHAMKQACGD